MTSSSLFLFAAVLCFAIHSCVGTWPHVVNSTRPPTVSKTPCEYKEIKKCNYQFKQVFLDAKDAARRDNSKPGIGKAVYCAALQTFMNCLELSLASCPVGSWLPNYSYVVLGHGIMDKKCGVCTGHQYENLEIALEAIIKRKQDYIGSDDCPHCAQDVHEKCVERFLNETSVNSNMCRDIQEFISCYKEEGDPQKLCVKETPIVKKFSNLCQHLGEEMLNEDRIHPGLMC